MAQDENHRLMYQKDDEETQVIDLEFELVIDKHCRDQHANVYKATAYEAWP